eukprot:GHVS01054934.1.p1 GENE.GHVS01054934.1~~GHVS01054934.1.p1  ORF type:complete len:439 (+),score=56.14 GHVS01054934.1:3-1319(+)
MIRGATDQVTFVAPHGDNLDVEHGMDAVQQDDVVPEHYVAICEFEDMGHLRKRLDLALREIIILRNCRKQQIQHLAHEQKTRTYTPATKWLQPFKNWDELHRLRGENAQLRTCGYALEHSEPVVLASPMVMDVQRYSNSCLLMEKIAAQNKQMNLLRTEVESGLLTISRQQISLDNLKKSVNDLAIRKETIAIAAAAREDQAAAKLKECEETVEQIKLTVACQTEELRQASAAREKLENGNRKQTEELKQANDLLQKGKKAMESRTAEVECEKRKIVQMEVSCRQKDQSHKKEMESRDKARTIEEVEKQRLRDEIQKFSNALHECKTKLELLEDKLRSVDSDRQRDIDEGTVAAAEIRPSPRRHSDGDVSADATRQRLRHLGRMAFTHRQVTSAAYLEASMIWYRSALPKHGPDGTKLPRNVAATPSEPSTRAASLEQ